MVEFEHYHGGSVLNKPLSEIEFSDVQSFCNSFTEGVRVEYKSEMIDKLPKVVSAFANTLGGIIVIGVAADKVKNKVTSMDGIDPVAGVEEKILSSCLDGIYPSVLPEVKVVEIPNTKKVLIVIKIHESKEAPHAVENTTRVYIRTGSLANPYDLSEIDRIEYLLKRRKDTAELKSKLVKAANDRLSKLFKNPPTNQPEISIVVSPFYPHRPLISLDQLYQFCNSMYHATSHHYTLDSPQRVVDGVCKFWGSPQDFSYREINHYGLIFIDDVIHKSASQWKILGQAAQDEQLFIRLTGLILAIGKTLRLATLFYRNCQYMGNLDLTVKLVNVSGESLMYSDNGYGGDNDFKPIDDTIKASYSCVAEELDSQIVETITALTKSILWAFNCPHDPRPRVEQVLRANKLM